MMKAVAAMREAARALETLAHTHGALGMSEQARVLEALAQRLALVAAALEQGREFK